MLGFLVLLCCFPGPDEGESSDPPKRVGFSCFFKCCFPGPDEGGSSDPPKRVGLFSTMKNLLDLH